MYASSLLISAFAFGSTLLGGFGAASSIEDSPSERASSDVNFTFLNSEFFSQHGSERVKFSYGPYSVPPVSENGGMLQANAPPTTPPCTNCLVTWIQAGLEYPDGTVADAASGMWLHHTVFSNLNKTSVVCPSNHGGDRFFASGNERTPANICVDGTKTAGYFVDHNDLFAMIVEMMNMSDRREEVYLTITYEYIPFVPEGFDKVQSLWLDIGGCHESSFPAEPGKSFQYSSPVWKSSSSGDVLLAISHLHDGGTHLQLQKNGEVICNAQATYKMVEHSHMDARPVDHISAISECRDLSHTEAGDEWSITAYYDSSKHSLMTHPDGSPEPVMGISLVYVTEAADELHDTKHHHKLRNAIFILVAVGILGMATVLMIRSKSKHGSFKPVWLGRRPYQQLDLIDHDSDEPLEGWEPRDHE